MTTEPSPTDPSTDAGRGAFYVMTSIPYVNADPHLGHALESVQADVLARHRRLRGYAVRLHSGTDDNSLKNVQAAEAQGVPVAELVETHADAFERLADPLNLSYDAFIRTGTDPRHRPGVERLWRQCAEAGDFYRRHYDGLYCVGCERFYASAELDDGTCPTHGVPATEVSEENWFFRLSRYQDRLADLLRSGELRIHPEARANEALAFVEGGLADFSISRTVARAHGWGVPVPGDPGQVMYVWWDALGNYLTALDYADPESAELRRWWFDSERRVHVIGKDILRFHAVYWPAMLLSAGLPLPTDIVVHDFLTIDGSKVSKSRGNGVDPVALAEEYGADALRWWFSSAVARTAETDFTIDRLVEQANTDLAAGVGNLVQRVVAMVRKYRAGVVPARPDPGADTAEELRLVEAADLLPARIDTALEAYDARAATAAIRELVAEANRYVEVTRPWELARAEADPEAGSVAEVAEAAGAAGVRLDRALAVLVDAGRVLGRELAPFVPDLAERVGRALGAGAEAGEPLPEVGPAYGRVDRRTSSNRDGS